MTAATPPADAAAPPRRRRPIWVWAVVGVAAVVVALIVARGWRPGQGGAGAGGDRASTGARAAAGDKEGGGRGAGSGRGDGKDRPVAVQVAAAATRDLPIALEGLGTVTAYKTVNVRPQVDGRLDKVAFTEGQAVKQGALLAQIDPRPFNIQLHQAQAALARDKAQLDGAERNLARYESVVKDRLIPQQQADDQRALVEQLRGTVQADQAAIENARLNLAYARITAPIDGVTGVRLIDQGNLVHATDATGIVVLTQMDPITVIFTLPQDDLPRVVARQSEAPLVVEALSRDGDQLLAKGTLALVDNQINQTTATMRLKAVFPNPERKLWPNQFVKTRLQLETRKGVLVVPAVAVQRGPQGSFVYVLGEGDDAGKAVMKPVDVAMLAGDQAVIGKGIAVGEKVVVEGQNQIRPGGKVTVASGGGGGGGGGGGEKKGGRRRP